MDIDKITVIVITAVVTVSVQEFGRWVIKSTAPLAVMLTTKVIKKIANPLVFDFILQSTAFIGVAYIFNTYENNKTVVTISDIRTMILLGIMMVISFIDFRKAVRALIFKEKV